ncbi:MULTISPECIES: hypothetical protein [unclassified Rhizobium]|uniref:hypothetical protein n=1 Tax=unclassified Rhizobium TaxID=2613769 RepID=UPI00071532DE|nr:MULTISPECIES: hypothetical protein [unclassified Rhizobium]KQS91260.1 hypothetical protein ASG42_11940 [Rhizobium sp. Leaf391]KQS96759.1 hypothetical protein ASG50_03690 [Rhizobium sp. Leaf386]KQU10314.1 hypothetical protein ASG68_01685 [Rhizobium sp. Leaf453]
MGMTREFRLYAGLFGIVAGSLVLTGCIGGPTYGTDKTAGEQLIEGLGSAVSLEGEKPKNVKYQPRPGLVLPPEGEQTALVQPQTNLASKENPQWIESPEETRQRLREEADANADNPGYVSPLAKASANGRALSKSEQTQAYREARKIQMGAYADKRRFLSDPPLEYRKLPEEATADLGEPEQVKERRRKKEAAIKGSGKKWYQIF